MALPISTGAAPTLNTVEVHRVQSTGLIDVAVALDAPRPTPSDLSEEMLEFGELCLRYGALILQVAVPAGEHSRLRVMAILYRAPVQGAPGRATDRGFAFIVESGRCTLAPPFPEALVAEVSRRTQQ